MLHRPAETVDDTPVRWTSRETGIVAAATFGIAAVSITQTMSVPLLPFLVESWDADRATVSWVATATLISSAAVNPIIGRAGDLYRKRTLVIVSLAVMIVGALLGMAAQSLALVIVARFVQGLGAGAIPLLMAVVRDELPPVRIARAMACVMVGGAGVGAGLGPVVSGVAVEAGGVRAAFAVSAAVGMIAIALVATRVRNRPVAARPPTDFDVAGSVGVVVVLVSVLLVLTKGGAWGWTSPPILALGAVAIVSGVLWFAWERRRVNPVVDLTVSKRPAVAVAHLGGLAAGAGTFSVYIIVATLVSLPVVSGVGLGHSLFVAGLVQVPGAVALSATLLALSTRAMSRLPLFLTAAGGATVVASGFLLSALWHGSIAEVVISVVVVNVGLGALFGSTPLLVLRGVAPDETAAAHAVNALARLTGSVLAATAASAIFAAVTVEREGETYPSDSAFVIVNVLAATLALLVAGAVLIVGRREFPGPSDP